MKYAAPLCLAFALAACNIVGSVESAIREDLSKNGATVSEVKMEQQADGSLKGHAVARQANGQEMRYNCTSKSSGDWECRQDPQNHLLTIKSDIRKMYESEGYTVDQLEMTSEGENRASGFIVIRQGDGPATRLPCRATPKTADQVDLQCG